MPEYKYAGPIDCEVNVDASNLRGKTAIVTGGCNGLGEAYTRALLAAEVTGKKLESEYPSLKFVECNTTIWADQVQLFNEAATVSPTGKIHYVVANAGISTADDVFSQDSTGEPQEPNLKVLDVNIKGTMFTAKLAAHYFIKQNGIEPSSKQEDTCLILIGSGAAFLDVPRTPQYCATKWAMRGIMHALRRTAFYYGSRVNVISPWYVRTNILSKEQFDEVTAKGVQFAEAEDGGRCLLRILADPEVNGHSFFLSARKWASSGFVDLDLDDYKDPLLKEIQEAQMIGSPVSMGLLHSLGRI